MAADLAPFPDIEDLLTQALAEFCGTGSTYPDDLDAALPFARILRVGGSDDRRTDAPLVDIEVAASTRAEAWRVAGLIQQRLISGPIRVPGVGIIDRTSTEIGPRKVLHENQRVRCVLTTYRVSSRRMTA